MPENAIIHASGLRKLFNNHVVLNGIDLQVQPGTVFALLGPNGAGKTTLVEILSTLLRPDAGTARVAGYDLLREPDKVRGAISLTGQYAAVDEYLTGEENMLMMGRLYHLSTADTRRRTSELLEHFDLKAVARQVVKTYSGGTRRRLDLAISLLATPPLIFLDEPTTGLDPHNRFALWAIIKSLAASGITIFLTTQYLEEADALASQIAIIDGGQIVAQGTANELKKRLGKDRLELNFADRAAFEKAQIVLATGIVSADEYEHGLTVAIDPGSQAIRKVMDDLEVAGVEAASLYVRKPTLDDVFLSLTGR